MSDAYTVVLSYINQKSNHWHCLNLIIPL
jgi:hypothetical protein